MPVGASDLADCPVNVALHKGVSCGVHFDAGADCEHCLISDLRRDHSRHNTSFGIVDEFFKGFGGTICFHRRHEIAAIFFDVGQMAAFLARSKLVETVGVGHGLFDAAARAIKLLEDCPALLDFAFRVGGDFVKGKDFHRWSLSAF